MRNFLLLFAAAGLSSVAVAQEVAYVDTATVGISVDYSAVEAGTTLCQTDNVTNVSSMNSEQAQLPTRHRVTDRL